MPEDRREQNILVKSTEKTRRQTVQLVLSQTRTIGRRQGKQRLFPRGEDTESSAQMSSNEKEKGNFSKKHRTKATRRATLKGSEQGKRVDQPDVSRRFMSRRRKKRKTTVAERNKTSGIRLGTSALQQQNRRKATVKRRGETLPKKPDEKENQKMKKNTKAELHS